MGGRGSSSGAGRRYGSANEVYQQVRRGLGEITGGSERQISFARTLRNNAISGYAQHTFDAQNKNPLIARKASDALRRYERDYEFARKETDARKILDRLADTGFRYGAM